MSAAGTTRNCRLTDRLGLQITNDFHALIRSQRRYLVLPKWLSS